MGAFGGCTRVYTRARGGAGVTRRMVFDSRVAYVQVNMDNERGAGLSFVSTVHELEWKVVGWADIDSSMWESFRDLQEAVDPRVCVIRSAMSGIQPPAEWEVIRIECATVPCAVTDDNFRMLYDAVPPHIIRVVVDRTAQGQRRLYQHQAVHPYRVWDSDIPIQRDPDGMPAHWGVAGMVDVLHRRVARLEGVLYHQAT